jgi:hypothetical protein
MLERRRERARRSDAMPAPDIRIGFCVMVDRGGCGRGERRDAAVMPFQNGSAVVMLIKNGESVVIASDCKT